MGRRLWITWETHRRSAELADAFGCDYQCIDMPDAHPLVRYWKSGWATWSRLRRDRPEAVFVQCPSIFLAVLVAFARSFGDFKYVIDAHNAVPNYLRRGTWLHRALARYACSRADLVIVTNDQLAEPIRQLRGTPAILTDKIPQIPQHPLPERFASRARPLITLISTFAWDEPIESFLEAVAPMEEAFTVVVTGKRSKAGELLRMESDKIAFADFLPEEEFIGLIRGSDLIVDLTIDELILVCGAYESVAVGVPVLLGDFEVTRSTFSSGCLYARDDAPAYRAALQQFFRNPEGFRREMAAFRPEFEARWQRQFDAIEEVLSGRPRPARAAPGAPTAESDEVLAGAGQ